MIMLEKLGRVAVDSLLIVLLLGILVIPVGFMGFLSIQDARTLEDVLSATTESSESTSSYQRELGK
jgi:hypothetical protein